MRSQPAASLPPLFLYDRDCGFCRRWVERWRARTRARVSYLPFQKRGLLRRLGISKRDARRASQLIESNGRRSQGATAVFRALLRAPGLRLVSRIGLLPGIRWIAEGVYRLVANHRVAASRIDRFLLGDRRAVPNTRYVRWLYLRLLGVVFFAAFQSLDRQVLGLFGSNGIRPVREILERTRELLTPSERRRAFPTIFWLDSSDAALKQVCRWGESLSLALVLNLAPRWTLLALYWLYLSFVCIGGSFLSFQWDALLLESGLQSALIAPGGLAPRLGRRPSWLSVFLMRWLAFRLHFESGLAKILSGDETWKKRTACCYYYETAPLPTALGWRAHHLPPRVNQASTRAALALELFAPWLAFGTRRLRRWGFGAFVTLQSTIAATANYGIFNLLSAVLSLWLLDDEDLLPSRARSEPTKRESLPQRLLVTAAAIPILLLSGAQLLARWREKTLPPKLQQLARQMAPLEAVNPYGLFSVMTTDRPEIVVEGSNDGGHWLPFEFRYKPGSLNRSPGLVAPHMPRLDWLMWFAALQGPPQWVLSFLLKLLEGSPQVTALLARNPFGDHPPRFVRAQLYDYRMTDLETRRKTGVWWKRKLLGDYVPAITLYRSAPAHP
jgi:predicted DCC family thiol-disulfide oxidoreductase YuxK